MIISYELDTSLAAMDTFRDGTILVFLLGFLTISSAGHQRQPSAGYNYKNVQTQETNSLSKILKAVLVHESTGHGVHSGSVANTGQSLSPGYSYSANQQMKANLGPIDLTTIRVFHESIGNTGNIEPQGFRVQGYGQRGIANAPRGFSHFGAQKPRGFLPRDSIQEKSSFFPTAFASDGENSGYQYKNSEAGQFYGAAQQIGSSGYQYPGPVEFLNAGPTGPQSGSTSNNLAVPTTGSGNDGLNGYQYLSPVQALNGGYSEMSSERVTNDGYHYESPRSMGYSYDNPSFKADNAASQGYRYDKPSQALHFDPRTRGSQYQKPSQNPATHQIGRPEQSSNSGYRYDSSTQSLDITYNKPDLNGRPETVFKGQPYLPEPPAAKESGYQYESPRAAETNGYRYEKPDLSGRPETVFKGQPAPPAAKESGYQYESPRSAENNGYRYDKPDLSGRPETVFKGQPAPKDCGYQYESAKTTETNGYRYDKPELSGRPATVFKGQPYLPLPPVSGGW